MEKLSLEQQRLEKLKKFIVSIIAILTLTGIFFTIALFERSVWLYPPQEKGVLDLRYFNFYTHQEPIPLDGEWLFYWNEFIVSSPPSQLPKPIILKTQESWVGKDIGYEVLPKYGYGSYYLNILLPISGNLPKLSMKIPQIASNYRLYINGSLAVELGKTGKTREDSIPYIRNHYIVLPIQPNDRNIEVVFEVSNYENEGSGFWQIPKIGLLDKIHKIQVFSVANDLFLFGALFIMGFYHWGIYFFHRSQKSILFFSFFAYLLAARIIITGERYILELFPFIDWVLLFRIEFLVLYLLPASFSIYIYYLFPKETNKKIIHLISIIVAIYSCTIILPIHIYTKFTKSYLIFMILVSLYVLFVNLRAVYEKREDSLVFLSGLVVLVLTAVYDIVQDFRNIRGFALAPYGFLVFVFIQAIVISSRIASNFAKTEKLTQSLARSNQELVELKEKLEKIVEERTKTLRETLDGIQKDLIIAKNIQSKIIPPNRILWENLEIASIYEPMDEVGGDIFDVTELSNHRVRVFLADALGHGVQAALLTMVIKSEYEGVKNLSYNPMDTIRNLSDFFWLKFSNLQTYFSCIVVDLDLESKKIIFASAGHPPQIFIHANQIIYLEKTAHIIGLEKNIQVQQIEYPFEPGDKLFLFSDGVYEIFDEKKKMITEEDFAKKLLEYHQLGFNVGKSIYEWNNYVKKIHKNGRLPDDFTLIAVSNWEKV